MTLKNILQKIKWKKNSTASITVRNIKIYHWLKYSNKTFLSRSADQMPTISLGNAFQASTGSTYKIIKKRFSHASDKLTNIKKRDFYKLRYYHIQNKEIFSALFEW